MAIKPAPQALPPAFVDRISEQLGPETGAFLSSMGEPYAAALRLNPRRPGAEAAALPFTDGAVPWCSQGRYIRTGSRPGLSPLHDAGTYYIQEASAMAPPAALNVEPGERVLDLCAAPGGKTGILADALGGRGLLVANEPEKARVRILSSTVERLGIANACVTNALPNDLAARLSGFFDAVLVDAPCSGEGMFRRDAAARGEWTPQSAAGCAVRQAAILDSAAELVRPGGRIVYSTCTFSRAENEDAVSAFLRRHPSFEAAAFDLPGVGPSSDGCVRLWPHRVRGDGQFAALLVNGAASRPAREKAKPSKNRRADTGAAARAALSEALKRLVDIVPGIEGLLRDARLTAMGRTLCAAPTDAPADIPAERIGLHLCRLDKGYAEPDHALAMALYPEQAARVFPCDDELAARYLKGEALPADGAGWTLVTYKNMPLGWGKVSGGMLKNHLPKGLRRG